MARVGIVFGLILCGLTVIGLVGTELKMPTQFYPMMLGIPVLFCGVVSLNPHRRKYAINVTATLALIGAVAGLVGSVRWFFSDGPAGHYAFLLTGSMSLICFCLFAFCLVSIRAAKKRRTAVSQSLPLPPRKSA
jgi:predicted branched-subunit amino acid permease